VEFDTEKLIMSTSCEIKWAIDNNSFNNKNNFIKNAFNQRASFFSFREGLVSHCPSGHSLNLPLYATGTGLKRNVAGAKSLSTALVKSMGRPRGVSSRCHSCESEMVKGGKL